MAIVFHTPIRSDFVEKYPMAKPVGLHDNHVVEYKVETKWQSHKQWVSNKA